MTAMMTCYNRASRTLACLETLFAQDEVGDSFSLSVVLVDDGSTDGTSRLVSEAYPNVRIVAGDGNLFWSGGMALAQATAETERPDALLWLNDDVVLDSGAVARAVEVMRASTPSPIVVGATRASDSPTVTYTGARRRGRRPGALTPVGPSTSAVSIDTFNGNFVLVPQHAYRTLGSTDARFVHAYGDIDYGLRAKTAGIRSVLLAGTIGVCDANPPEASWRYRHASRRERVRLLFSRKGYPPRSHFLYNIKHAGASGILFAALSYANALTRIALGR